MRSYEPLRYVRVPRMRPSKPSASLVSRSPVKIIWRAPTDEELNWRKWVIALGLAPRDIRQGSVIVLDPNRRTVSVMVPKRDASGHMQRDPSRGELLLRWVERDVVWPPPEPPDATGSDVVAP